MTSATTFQSSNEPEFGYGQLIGVMLRRWPWIVGALGISMAGAVYVSTQEEPTYQSSMQLIVEPNYEDDLTARDFSGGISTNASEVDYNTQLNLMRSQQFIDETVEALKDQHPDLTASQAKGGFSLTRILEGEKATRIFEASYTDNDPTLTKQFLEELKDVYLEYNKEQQANRLNRGLDQINERLANTRENLQNAQAGLEEFRQSQSLIDPTTQGQAIVEALNQVQNEQRQLIAELNQAEARYGALQEQLALSPQTALMASRLSQSTRVQGLLNGLQEAELALADRRILFTDNDPTVQVLIEQRENKLTQLREEISAVMRQPISELDPELMSLLQLGQIDISLTTQLIEADAALQSLAARSATLTELEGMLRTEINRYPSLIAEYDRLQPSVEIERTTLQQLLEQREQLSAELARDGYNWQVVQAPELGTQTGPDPVKPLALGIVAGLFIGGALAFARESMDKVVRTSEELKKQVPLPLLGILPTQVVRRSFPLTSSRRESVDGLHPELAGSDLMQTVLWLPFRESLDLIANQLQLMQKEHTSQAIAVTSGLPGEGKTTVTLGLALSLARMNQRVLLIDADMRRSGLQTELGLVMEQGLSSLILGKSGTSRPHRLDFANIYLDVLPAGPAPEDPITLLSSPRFKALIARCKERYDVVLVDTPPVLGMADALKVGGCCDGTVLVARLDRITQPELTEVISTLAPLNVLGIIANGAKGAPTRYSNYGNQAYASAAESAA